MSSAPLLEVNVEGGKLRAISLHDACNRVGAFYDLWISDPEKATAALKRSKVHPLRGCFDPAEPESEVEALEKEDAGLRLAREKISAKIEGKSTEYWVAGALLAFSLLFPQIYVWVLHAQGGFGPAMTDGGAAPAGLASVALTTAAFYSYQDAFGTIISFDDVTKHKPDPEIYLLAASRLGVAPESCWVVEDSSTGVKAGKAAGMRVVAVPNEYTRPTHDFSLADAVAATMRDAIGVISPAA